MKYRDHRGGFTESMKTTIEVDTIEELVAHLSKTYGEVKSVKFKYLGYDERNKWETFYVSASSDKKDYVICGMSDGNFRNKTTHDTNPE